MAARFLNQEMSSEISGEIETFYRKLEKKYYNGLAQDAIPQKLALQDLFKELKEMKERTMKVHSESSPREKLKFKQSDLHDMACSEVRYWKKAIMRRQYLTAKHSHPWLIEFSSRLQGNIFMHIVNIMTCTSMFGVKTRAGRTNEQIVEVTNKGKLQQLLSIFLGIAERSLKRQIPGKGRTDVIIDQQKPFIITYNSSFEIVKVQCHYGAWNCDDVPQFT